MKPNKNCEAEQIVDLCQDAQAHIDIEALSIKAKTLMADMSIPIEERIQQTWDIYKKADEWAEHTAIPKEKYVELLYDYGELLSTCGLYDDDLKIMLRECQLREELYGYEHPDTATSYHNIGLAYMAKGESEQALMYFQKALEIREKMLGAEHPDTKVTLKCIELVKTP